MTTFVSTLGFNTSHLQSLIVSEDVSDGDHLVLVRPDDDDSRGEGAVQDMEGFVEMIDHDISSELLTFDPDGFENATTSLVDMLNGIDDEVVVNLAGGDRALVIALTVATMSTEADVRATYVRSDVTHESHDVRLPELRPGLDDENREILRYVLRNGPVSNTQIASLTGMSESTVSRRLDTVEQMGLVDVQDGEGRNFVETTLAGEVVGKRLSQKQ